MALSDMCRNLWRTSRCMLDFFAFWGLGAKIDSHSLEDGRVIQTSKVSWQRLRLLLDWRRLWSWKQNPMNLSCLDMKSLNSPQRIVCPFFLQPESSKTTPIGQWRKSSHVFLFNTCRAQSFKSLPFVSSIAWKDWENIMGPWNCSGLALLHEPDIHWNSHCKGSY